MKNILAPVILSFALAAPALAETRDLGGFESVSAADRTHVIVSMGPRHSVVVEGRDAASVRTRVHDGALEITNSERAWWFGGPRELDAIVRVTLPRVESLAAARGAELRADNITAEHISLAAAMGAELNISGVCTSVEASVAMGASIDAEDFHCNSADVSASMGGEAEIYAANTFDASASMGGDISVAGAGARGNVATSMGGSVSQN